MSQGMRAFDIKEKLQLSWSSFQRIAAMAECPLYDPDQFLSEAEQQRLTRAVEAWQHGIDARWLADIAKQHQRWLRSDYQQGLRATLQGACLVGAALDDLNLAHVLLVDADLEEVQAVRTIFDHGDLTGANFAKSTLTDARFCAATLTDACFDKAHISGATIDKDTIELSEWDDTQVATWVARGGKLERSTAKQLQPVQDFSENSISSLVDELDQLTYLRYRNKTNDSQSFSDQDRRRLQELVTQLWGRPRAKPGDIVAEARLEAVLGKGAFGTVWRAVNVETGQPRAVKIFDHDRLGDGLAAHLFRRGVRAMQYLRQCVEAEHSRSSLDPLVPQTLVQIREIEPSLLAFAMDLVPDRDLSHGQMRGKSIADKLRVFTKIAKSVRYAHTRPEPIVHRDLKPQNIVMNRSLPVLTDFDIADMSFAKTLSRRAVGGAFAYAAPEQLSGECDHLEFRSDIYSLGRLLHFFLLEEDPPLLIEAEPVLDDLNAYPEGLVKIIRKCTYRQLPHRYDSVDALLHDIAQYEESAKVGSYGPNKNLAQRYWQQAKAHATRKEWSDAVRASDQALAYLPKEQEQQHKDWLYQQMRWQWRDGQRRLIVPIALQWWKRLPFVLALLLCGLLLSPLLYLGVAKVIRDNNEQLFEGQLQHLLKARSLRSKEVEQAIAYFQSNPTRQNAVHTRLIDLLRISSPTQRCRIFLLLYKLIPNAPAYTALIKNKTGSDVRTHLHPLGLRLTEYIQDKGLHRTDFGHIRCEAPQKLLWLDISAGASERKDQNRLDTYEIRLEFHHSDFSLLTAKYINVSLFTCAHCDLRQITLQHSSAYHLRISYSNANAANFRHARMIGSRFSYSLLRFADFRHANMRNVFFFRCDLRGAIWDKNGLEYTDISQSIVNASALPALRRARLHKKFFADAICLSGGLFFQPGLIDRCYAWHNRHKTIPHQNFRPEDTTRPPYCPKKLTRYSLFVSFAPGTLQQEGHCPWQLSPSSRPASGPTTRSKL